MSHSLSDLVISQYGEGCRWMRRWSTYPREGYEWVLDEDGEQVTMQGRSPMYLARPIASSPAPIKPETLASKVIGGLKRKGWVD